MPFQETRQKQTNEIIQRMGDYNRHFSQTLLRGLTLKALSCQFLDTEEDYFTSIKGLKALFFLFQDEYHKNNTIPPFVYKQLVIKKGELSQSNLFDLNDSETKMRVNDAIADFDKSNSANKFFDFGENLLITIFGVDIDGNKKMDLTFISIFEINDTNIDFNYIDFKEQMKEFLEYPADFFNTPILTNYFQALNFRYEAQNYAHTTSNMFPNALLIIENTKDFLKKNHKDSEEYLDIKMAYKQLKIVDLATRLLAQKRMSEYDIKNKNIKGILDFVTNNCILAQGVSYNYRAKDFVAKTYKQEWDVIPSEANAAAIFSLLFNIWNNAVKGRVLLTNEKTPKITVKLEIGHTSDSELYILVENPCTKPICLENINKLLSNKTLRHEKGLGIIRQKLRYLGWRLSDDSIAENGIVRLIILTPPQKK